MVHDVKVVECLRIDHHLSLPCSICIPIAFRSVNSFGSVQESQV